MSSLRNVGSEFVVTQDGLELLDRQPELDGLLAEVVASEFANPKGVSDYEPIGFGRHGRVSAIPEVPNLCVKMSSSAITEQAHFLGDSKKGDPENLLVQTRFLDQIRRELVENPEHEIDAPRQFFAARSNDGVFVSIQERIVAPFTALSSLRTSWQHSEDYRQLVGLVRERVEIAFGGTALRFAIDDLWHSDGMNVGNVLIDTTDSDDFISLANARLYVIDQPAHRFKTARAVLRFAKS
ncbi:hypothetical protein KDA00_03795 [Candidatus Saccharibacteria bacterium]|nr:hypothetical protein [Candidatus Saccharibacteria bacterium]